MRRIKAGEDSCGVDDMRFRHISFYSHVEFEPERRVDRGACDSGFSQADDRTLLTRHQVVIFLRVRCTEHHVATIRGTRLCYAYQLLQPCWAIRLTVRFTSIASIVTSCDGDALQMDKPGDCKGVCRRITCLSMHSKYVSCTHPVEWIGRFSLPRWTAVFVLSAPLYLSGIIQRVNVWSLQVSVARERIFFSSILPLAWGRLTCALEGSMYKRGL